jgi:hypothetical protein
MSSPAASAMYPGLADKQASTGQGKIPAGISAGEAVYGKRAEPAPTGRKRKRTGPIYVLPGFHRVQSKPNRR